MSQPRHARSARRLRLGARPHARGTTFRICAPEAAVVRLHVESGSRAGRVIELAPVDDGLVEGDVEGVTAGDRYRYSIDEAGPFPDPASRFQPDGVHGSSEVVDPAAYRWTDDAWTRRAGRPTAIYELHLGAFSPAGTFADAIERLPSLAEVGVTAIELMPVADFAGDRNWGYDGVALYAPARCYGRPDDLRGLVDTAHGLGLAVLLDVVYNHLGPDGAYLPRFWPRLFSETHASPWGAGINLDGAGSALVRDLILDNACAWIEEFHLDGLRLDATHALADTGATHVVAELASAVHALDPDAPPLVVAEDHRNLAIMVTPRESGGWGLDGVWADDFHHQCRRLLAGDRDGYFEDFSGSTRDLAATIRQGWFFTGQPSGYLGGPRGTDPAGVPHDRFVVCLQNHDQIGNRAFGDRLHHAIDLAAYRAATALLLMVPETPLLFMGQEWAATTPFPYFTDHGAELGRRVTEGRRAEFGRFEAFADEAARARIPDPQAHATFASAKLRWSERDREPHASILRLHARLLDLRARQLPGREGDDVTPRVEAIGADAIAMCRATRNGGVLVLVARLRGAGPVDLGDADGVFLDGCRGGDLACVLTTEDASFAPDPSPPTIGGRGVRPHITFSRPGAVVLAS